MSAQECARPCPMRKPHLALCLEYSVLGYGGTEVLVAELIRGLSRNFTISLVSSDQSLQGTWVESLIFQHFRWDSTNPTRESCKALAEQLAGGGVQLAHFHCGGAFAWGMRFIGRCPIGYTAKAGVICVTTVHLVVSLFSGYCGPRKPYWFRLLLLPVAWLGKAHVLSCLAAEIAVSKHDLKKLRLRYSPFAGRFQQIYHSRLHDTGERHPRSNTKVILNVGHVAWRKGQHLLAAAFARIAARYPEWHLKFAGPILEEDCGEYIRHLAEQTGLQGRIELLGSRADTSELMREASIYVQPSLQEALGLALQEALWEGCACVGAQTGGIPELITHGENGLLFRAGDVASLACALERLLSTPPLRDRFSSQGRASITEKQMTAKEMTARHMELYGSLLSRT